MPQGMEEPKKMKKMEERRVSMTSWILESRIRG